MKDLIKLNTKSWQYQKLLTESSVKVFVTKSLKTDLEKIKARRFPTLYQKVNSSGFRSGKHLITLLVEKLGRGVKLILTEKDSQIDGLNVYINYRLYDKIVSKNFFPLYRELGFASATEFLVSVLDLKIKPHQRQPQYKQIHQFISTLPRSGKQLSAKKTDELVANVGKVVKQAGVDSKRLTSEILKESDAAIRQAFYKGEIKTITDTIRKNFLDKNKSNNWENKKYRPWFVKNNWIFGIEYSGLLDKSRFTTECIIDLALVTYDGYVDVIEVKTPNLEILNLDSSHKIYFPSPELSNAISQALKYIHCLESEQNTINVKALSKNRRKKINMAPLILKPRVKIVIGHKRNWSNEELEEKFKALRLINDGLTNIHIYTFDQILDIGNKMIKNYER